MIDRALRHPLRASLWALAVALASTIALTTLAHHGAFSRAFSRFDGWWLLVALGAELASIGAYALAYQRIIHAVAHRRLSARVSLGMVLMGFASFAFFGGFALDRRGLKGAGADPRETDRAVLGLGVIELFVLSVGAWVAAVILVIVGAPISAGMVWPWIIAAPAVIATVLAVSHAGRYRGRRATRLERLASATEDLFFGLLREPLAWLGIAAYFSADLVALGAALCAFGVGIHSSALIDCAALVVAYGSGFLFTRRTLPLAGAGIVEVMLTLSLIWVGAHIAAAIAAVFAFRVLNLGVVGMLGLPARRRLLGHYGIELPVRRRRLVLRRRLPSVPAPVEAKLAESSVSGR